MNSSRREALAATAAMTGGWVTSLALTPDHLLADTLPAFDLNRDIPKIFGSWNIDESIIPVLPSPDVSQALNKIYDQLVSRTYVSQTSDRIMLSIAYGATQTRQLRAHRQEVCYSAQGFTILELARDELRLLDRQIPTTRMVAKMGNRTEPVTYWFTMGNKAVMSILDRQRVQFAYAMRGLIADGFLVRISSIDEDRSRASAVQKKFAEELFGSLGRALRDRLLGTKD